MWVIRFPLTNDLSAAFPEINNDLCGGWMFQKTSCIIPGSAFLQAIRPSLEDR